MRNSKPEGLDRERFPSPAPRHLAPNPRQEHHAPSVPQQLLVRQLDPGSPDRQNTLDYLDDLDIDHLCVVPWADGEIDAWRFARNAVDLLGGSTSRHEPVLDPVVKAALETLTLRINLSTGPAHPSVRSAAISMFRLLKGAGYQWDLDEIRIWAMQDGWRSGDIPDLVEKATASPRGGATGLMAARRTEGAVGRRKAIGPRLINCPWLSLGGVSSCLVA